MHKLPETGFLRGAQIYGSRAKGIPAILPICRATWWAGVKSGKFPSGIKIGPRTTVWRVEDIKELIEKLSRGEA